MKLLNINSENQKKTYWPQKSMIYVISRRAGLFCYNKFWAACFERATPTVARTKKITIIKKKYNHDRKSERTNLKINQKKKKNTLS